MSHHLFSTNSSMSSDPSKVCEFKKYFNRLNYLKNISKKTYFVSTLICLKVI